MRKIWICLAAGSALAFSGCEDGPDQLYGQAPPGAGDRWNDGEQPPTWDDGRTSICPPISTAFRQLVMTTGPTAREGESLMRTSPPPPLTVFSDPAAVTCLTG